MSFINFLKEKKIIESAIGYILATSINNFVKTGIIVFIDPIVNKIAGKDQQEKKINILGIEIEIGKFIIELIDFIIIILLIYIITKHIMKSDKQTKFNLL